MNKNPKKFKSGDFIFAKVKGYPAWPARVQQQNGNKYSVYFYGTAETTNLGPNKIFDYAENKDKFLSKVVKRKDFNDGVRQIEHDFANNVPLEDLLGVPLEPDLRGRGRPKKEFSKDENKKEEGEMVNRNRRKIKKKIKIKIKLRKPATPKRKDTRGRPKKEFSKHENKKEEGEMVNRSGGKIKPKRPLDEQAGNSGENSTLPSPAKKRRRGSPPAEELPEAKENKKPHCGI